jgi:hypothetical protein
VNRDMSENDQQAYWAELKTRRDEIARQLGRMVILNYAFDARGLPCHLTLEGRAITRGVRLQRLMDAARERGFQPPVRRTVPEEMEQAG